MDNYSLQSVGYSHADVIALGTLNRVSDGYFSFLSFSVVSVQETETLAIVKAP